MQWSDKISISSADSASIIIYSRAEWLSVTPVHVGHRMLVLCTSLLLLLRLQIIAMLYLSDKRLLLTHRGQGEYIIIK